MLQKILELKEKTADPTVYTLQIILRFFQLILKLLVGVNFKGRATASA